MDLIRNQFFIGFFINFILIYIFCKIPLMTKSGWVSAGILGTILWGCLSWQGWMSVVIYLLFGCLLYTSPSPRDATLSRMPSSA